MRSLRLLGFFQEKTSSGDFVLKHLPVSKKCQALKSQWLHGRGWESERHLWPRRLLCGNCAFFCSPFDGFPLLSSPMTAICLDTDLLKSTTYHHTHTQWTALLTPPSSLSAESTLVQEGCSCFCGPRLRAAWSLGWGKKRRPRLRDKMGLFEKIKEAGGRGKGLGTHSGPSGSASLRAECVSVGNNRLSVDNFP